MSQVKAEVALNLLKCFRWLVQSRKTTLVSFYIAQKEHIKDSRGSVSQAMIHYANKHLMRRRLCGSQEQTTFSSEFVI